MKLTRRLALETAAIGVCDALLRAMRAKAQDTPDGGPPGERYEAYAREGAPAGGGGGGYGSTTSPDIEGPFYRPEAPFRDDLSKDAPGRLLTLQGRVVRGAECVPVAGAVLDVWQADADGHYDNDDPRRPPTAFRLRGRVRTDGEGRFELRTIRPGHYRIGRDLWRPAHLHVKVSAAGCVPLTTQLYFQGDPHNARDRWFDASRALEVLEADGSLLAEYELVLAPRE